MSGADRRERILIVDDQPDVRAIAVAMLTARGYETRQARTASEALELLDGSDAIDLVLTDLTMPGVMSGLDLSSEIRRRWPQVPVVIISGDPSWRTHLTSEARGRHSFLRKPFRTAELVQSVRDMLDARETKASS